MTDTRAILADLTRAKAMFQARTITAALGVQPPAPEAFCRNEDSTTPPIKDIGRP